jgi:hypothetical protein
MQIREYEKKLKNKKEIKKDRRKSISQIQPFTYENP